MAAVQQAKQEQSGIGNLLNVGKVAFGAATGNPGLIALGGAGLTKNGSIGGIVSGLQGLGAFDPSNNAIQRRLMSTNITPGTSFNSGQSPMY